MGLPGERGVLTGQSSLGDSKAGKRLWGTFAFWEAKKGVERKRATLGKVHKQMDSLK